MVAIIPAAGLGTRMASITGGAPKELLGLGRRSVLERVIDEAIRAGADETIVVSSPNKPQIADAIADWSRGLFREARVHVAYQSAPRGLADAIFVSEEVDGDVLVLLGDCVYRGDSPTERMSRLIYRGIDACIAVETVSDEDVRRYGICEVDGMGTIRRIVEKPTPDEVASRWAVAARYAFGAETMAYMRGWFEGEAIRRPEGEISLTDAISWAIAQGLEFKAVVLQPGQERVDCGTPEEYDAARRLAWD